MPTAGDRHVHIRFVMRSACELTEPSYYAWLTGNQGVRAAPKEEPLSSCKGRERFLCFERDAAMEDRKYATECGVRDSDSGTTYI